MVNGNSSEIISLSPLGQTWIFDLDGTIVKHNGYKLDGKDTLLPGVEQFFRTIPEKDFVLIVTARLPEWKEVTESFLREHSIRFNQIVYGVPYGERILVNDKKVSGLHTAYAINTNRDEFMTTKFIIDENL